VGEGQRTGAITRFQIGFFTGRDTALTLQADLNTVLRYRIPQELFRDRERFTAEIRTSASAESEAVLWAKRWEVAWRGATPFLEPVADLSSLGPEPSDDLQGSQ